MNHSARPVSLRPLEPLDAEVIAGWAEDLDFCREADWVQGLTFFERRQVHRRVIESPPSDLIRLGAVQGGALVGYVDLHGDEPGRREIGFVIGERDRWGGGMGRGAATAGLDYGFDKLGLREIWAEALDSNQRSVRLLQRLGFLETGRGDEALFLGRPTYYRQFAMTAAQWARLHTS
ncbi:GNAT family N-acetyltransferase [Kribbella sp. NPDC055071]